MNMQISDDSTGPAQGNCAELERQMLIKTALRCIMELDAHERKEVLSKYMEV